MLTVREGELVVEEKGIYSIEKFLIARRIMYWQVYLHKTSLGAEQLLIQTLKRARFLTLMGERLSVSEDLQFFLHNAEKPEELISDPEKLLYHFSGLDDVDITAALKQFQRHSDPLLSFLSSSLMDRRLFRVEVQPQPFAADYTAKLRERIIDRFRLDPDEVHHLLIHVRETNTAYSTARDEIKVLLKNGRVVPISMISEHNIQDRAIEKHFLCYPKTLLADHSS